MTDNVAYQRTIALLCVHTTDTWWNCRYGKETTRHRRVQSSVTAPPPPLMSAPHTVSWPTSMLNCARGLDWSSCQHHRLVRQRQRVELSYRQLSPPPPTASSLRHRYRRPAVGVPRRLFELFGPTPPPPPSTLCKKLYHRPLQQCAPRLAPSAARSSCASSSFAFSGGAM